MQQPSTVIDIQTQNRSLYTVLQQEVDIGAAALKQGNADMAVTLFSSALQKLSPDQPFYDHLIHNLLLAYKLQIEEAFRSGDAASAKNILERALQLEVAGEMADRQRHAGGS